MGFSATGPRFDQVLKGSARLVVANTVKLPPTRLVRLNCNEPFPEPRQFRKRKVVAGNLDFHRADVHPRAGDTRITALVNGEPFSGKGGGAASVNGRRTAQRRHGGRGTAVIAKRCRAGGPGK